MQVHHRPFFHYLIILSRCPYIYCCMFPIRTYQLYSEQNWMNLGLIVKEKLSDIFIARTIFICNIKIFLSSVWAPVTMITASNSASMKPAAHLSAKEIPTATCTFQQGSAGQASGGSALRTNITWPEISFQTKVWEHLIRNCNSIWKAGMKNYRRVFLCSKILGHCWRGWWIFQVERMARDL